MNATDRAELLADLTACRQTLLDIHARAVECEDAGATNEAAEAHELFMRQSTLVEALERQLGE